MVSRWKARSSSSDKSESFSLFLSFASQPLLIPLLFFSVPTGSPTSPLSPPNNFSPELSQSLLSPTLSSNGSSQQQDSLAVKPGSTTLLSTLPLSTTLEEIVTDPTEVPLASDTEEARPMASQASDRTGTLSLRRWDERGVGACSLGGKGEIQSRPSRPRQLEGQRVPPGTELRASLDSSSRCRSEDEEAQRDLPTRQKVSR